MGDRVWCNLTLKSGSVTVEQLDEVFEDFPYEDRVDNVLTFGDVDYGQLPDEIIAALCGLGVSFFWTWGAGGDYAEGGLYCNATTMRIRDVVTNDGNTVMSLEEANDDERRRKLNEWITWFNNLPDTEIVE